jgi:hypothetical protein
VLLELFIPIAVLKYGAGRIRIKILNGNELLFGAGFTRFFYGFDPNLNNGIVINWFHGGYWLENELNKNGVECFVQSSIKS